MKDIVIIGAGGFGREVAFLISRINTVIPTYRVLGFLDDGVAAGTRTGVYTVLGGVGKLSEMKGVSACIAVGYSRVRSAIYNKISDITDVDYPNLTDPSAVISESVKFGRGCIVCAGAVLTVDISLGDFVMADVNSTIGHDARLGDFVTLFPSVNISGCDKIGNGTDIGVGAQILQGITVGEHSAIGAGAVVIRDVPPYSTCVGVPARVIKTGAE